MWFDSSVSSPPTLLADFFSCAGSFSVFVIPTLCYLRTFPHSVLIAWNAFLTLCLTHSSCFSQLTYQYFPEGSPLAPPLSQITLHH